MPWSVGVEEEIMILDADTLEQVPRVADLVAAADVPTGRLKTELFASVVELNTDVCASSADAVSALRDLRRAAAAAAHDLGLEVAAAGSHPASVAEEQEIAPEERYNAFVEYAGVTARRQGVNGLHVHVGMPDPETCLSVLEALLPWLPLVLALSANSPYLDGRETGLMSARAEVLGLLPRSGAPPAFGSYEGWQEFVARFRRTGIPLGSDYTSFWWDVRPHPNFGTLEIRMPDQPTALDRTAALVALLQSLCRALAEATPAVDPARRGDYAQNRWAAARYGPRARLIHPDGERTVDVAELTSEVLELVRPAAQELGVADLLAAIDPETCEGDRQLEVGRSNGLRAVAADLVERSLASVL
jgi:glutamate---cysteine ligase / carboxylate-amine ligase